ncbi:uncharacterized protein LOC141609306 [Silene latifolia]|uniref:uncharacterized protein LOC141609306 n=1 Tax=Silene latifolia TaxID=37657 RepID=UPI003D770FEB
MSKKNLFLHYSVLHGYVVLDSEDGFDGLDVVDPTGFVQIPYDEVLHESHCLQYSVNKNKERKRKNEEEEEHVKDEMQKWVVKERKEIGKLKEEEREEIDLTNCYLTNSESCPDSPTPNSLDPDDLGSQVEETKFDDDIRPVVEEGGGCGEPDSPCTKYLNAYLKRMADMRLDSMLSINNLLLLFFEVQNDGREEEEEYGREEEEYGIEVVNYVVYVGQYNHISSVYLFN